MFFPGQHCQKESEAKQRAPVQRGRPKCQEMIVNTHGHVNEMEL
jgi:hypothetical protein